MLLQYSLTYAPSFVAPSIYFAYLPHLSLFFFYIYIRIYVSTFYTYLHAHTIALCKYLPNQNLKKITIRQTIYIDWFSLSAQFILLKTDPWSARRNVCAYNHDFTHVFLHTAHMVQYTSESDFSTGRLREHYVDLSQSTLRPICRPLWNVPNLFTWDNAMQIRRFVQRNNIMHYSCCKK